MWPLLVIAGLRWDVKPVLKELADKGLASNSFRDVGDARLEFSGSSSTLVGRPPQLLPDGCWHQKWPGLVRPDLPLAAVALSSQETGASCRMSGQDSALTSFHR